MKTDTKTLQQMCPVLRNNWKRHKPICDHNVEEADGKEPTLQRHLWHWVARFDTSLLHACIRGLNLKYEWENLDEGAVVLFMEPRSHPNVACRWRIQHAGIFRNEDILQILAEFKMAEQFREQVYPMHARERMRLQKSSGGDADYAKILIIAGNVGADRVEGNHPPTLRWTPTDVSKGMVARIPMERYEGDWVQDLKDQVERDCPLNVAQRL
ncbi:hypothetical protein R3P38DRAFT_3182608 [Favolaschia claudopus]|uniref:Uncharacterized protein n=1 Tax=Favolaschia claudopus TaxID=2862362 RepID=A0AAW0CHW5_9AGAR